MMFLGLTRAILPCLFTVLLTAADNPFVGQWKPNLDRSKVSGQTQTIRDLGGNKYEFTLGATTYAIVADGTDQPTPYGSTMSLKPDGENSWTVVRKKDGRTLAHAQWTITPDGKTWNLHTKGTNVDGSPFDTQATATRVVGGPGLAGTWELQNLKLSAPDLMEISSCDENAVTFIYPANKGKLDLKFDGKEYAGEGPLASKNMSYSGKRLDASTFEVTRKREGKVISRVEYKVSPDGKTLTEINHNTGQNTPMVLVYERP
jgi:hypothetical protein